MADVVVVGAGALGLSTALHLALLGRDVVVLDRGAAGAEASGRAAGLFKSVQPDELRTVIARRSIDRAVGFADWAGVNLPVQRSGSLMVARTDRHARVLGDEVAASRGWGVPIADQATADLAARGSLYQPSGGEAAWWCPDDVYVDEPMALVNACVEALRAHGGELREGERVVGVEVAAGAVAAVQTAAERIPAVVVVDAAGAWARRVAELAGGWLPLAPVRHQLVITAPDPGVDPTGPVVRVVDAAVYLRPARGGVMVGGFEPDPLPLDPRAHGADFATDDVPMDLDPLRRMAAAVAEQAPAATVEAPAVHRAGLFTMVPDGRFVLGPVPGVDGLWVASGCNGSGFSSSLGLGEGLAAQIAGVSAYADLTALAPARLGRLPDHELVARGVWQYAHYYEPGG